MIAKNPGEFEIGSGLWDDEKSDKHLEGKNFFLKKYMDIVFHSANDTSHIISNALKYNEIHSMICLSP